MPDNQSQSYYEESEDSSNTNAISVEARNPLEATSEPEFDESEGENQNRV